MKYVELFERPRAHLSSMGIDVTFKCGASLSDSEIEDANKQLPFPLPPSLIEFFREFGNGVVFLWDDGTHRGTMSTLLIEPLAEVIAAFEAKKQGVHFDDDYTYPHVDDPKLALRTAQRMRQWLPVLLEGNGDSICIDCGIVECPVVFNQHDWMDGGSGSNGHVMGPNLLAFLTSWSTVCFQNPSSLWWPSVFSTDGIDWISDEFDAKFRLSPR